MNSTLLTILALTASILGLFASGFALWQLRELNTLRHNFFSGAKGKDLEEVINQLSEGLHTLQENQVILENRIKNLRSDFGLAVQKVGLVRFNPFSDGGGNLSFCIAFLDGHNSGMVITSMHGREQNRVYSKQIFLGKCDIQLTEEELLAIEQANNEYYKHISK